MIICRCVTSPLESLPSDLAAAHAMLLAERAARLEAEAEAANAKADLSSTEALISYLKLEIEKLRRQPFMATAPSARRGFWSRWSFSSKIWKWPRLRTKSVAEKAADRAQTVRWRWRRSSALTRCSISSVASTGLPPTNVW